MTAENLWADLELASGPNNTVTLASERPATVAMNYGDTDLDGNELAIVEITVDLDACAARVSLPLNLLLEHISTAMGLR